MTDTLVLMTAKADAMRSCEVRRTEFTEGFLNGSHNYVSWNGIDTWIGGVHLDSVAGALWFRDANDALVDV